jgi:hypothetical protein
LCRSIYAYLRISIWIRTNNNNKKEKLTSPINKPMTECTELTKHLEHILSILVAVYFCVILVKETDRWL